MKDFWCIDIIRMDMHPLAHGYKKVQSYEDGLKQARELVKSPLIHFVAIHKNGDCVAIIK